ncbi:hypothetical protein BDV18DRAFT_162891 [Aspergillus unguis]
MRSYLCVAALAVTAAALPQKRDATPTSKNSKRSSENDLQYICELPGPDKDDWDDLNMGFWTNSTSMMWCESADPEICSKGAYEMSFPKTIANSIGHKEDFSCIAGESCDIPTDADKCSNPAWAKYTFILKSLKNLHDHLNKVLSTLKSGQTSYASQQTYFVEQYTTAASEDSSAASIETILAGIFGIASGFVGGPITKLGGTASGTAAGIAGIASGGGALMAGVQNVLSMNIASELEKKMETISDMNKAFTDGFEAAMDAVKTIHQQALEDIPSNSDILMGYSYKDVPTGAVAMINNGAFAESMTTADTLASDQAMRKILSAAAVSYVWRNHEKVFVAKMTDNLYGVPPCDISLNNLYRVCDNGVAYFFIKYEEHEFWDIQKDWTVPAGAEEFDDKEDLTLAEFAAAAEANQKAHGYDLTFDPKSAADLFLSENPAKDGLLVNVPVCFLDAAIKATLDADHSEVYGTCESDPGDSTQLECSIKRILIDTCLVMPNFDSSWPYEIWSGGNNQGLTDFDNTDPHDS